MFLWCTIKVRTLIDGMLVGLRVNGLTSILHSLKLLPVTVLLCRLDDCKKKDGNQGGSRGTMMTATAMWVDTGKQGRKGIGTAFRTSLVRTVYLPRCRNYPACVILVASGFLRENISQ